MYQDSIKGAYEYNPVMREADKMVLNSLSGKMNEKPKHFDFIDITDQPFNPDFEYNNIFESNGRVYLKEQSDENAQTYVHFGTFIYAYSRDVLFEMADEIGRENVIATETDSLYISANLLPKLNKFVGKEFGQLEVEMNNIDYAYFLGKKLYLVHDGETNNLKMKWKGVPGKYLSEEAYKNYFKNGTIDFNVCQFKRCLFTEDETAIYIGDSKKTITKQIDFKEYTE